MKIVPAIFVFLCFWPFRSFGSSNPVYDNNENIRHAHQFLYAFRPLSAEKLLNAEAMKNPDNAYVTFYRLYSEIITLTISNSPEQYEKRVSMLNQYVEKLKKLPDNAPDYRMLFGEAKVFTGLLEVKYDSKFHGLMDCLKGYNLLEENAKKYPLFEPDSRIPGMFQIAVAFMPKVLQLGIKLLGIRSNPEAGLRKLSDFAKFAKGKPGYEEEAFLLTMAAYKLMNQNEAAMKMIDEKMANFKESALLNYIAATISLDANQTETALRLLSNIEPQKMEIAFPQLMYMKGKAKLSRLDPDSDIPMISYLKSTTGIDYIKSTLYDLACFYYISGNNAEYKNYLEQVKNKGRELQSRDIEAEYEANRTDLPNICLMRADFLVRGGYVRKAEDELSKIFNSDSLKEYEKVQYFYLKGESKRMMNLSKQAESEYLNALRTSN